MFSRVLIYLSVIFIMGYMSESYASQPQKPIEPYQTTQMNNITYDVKVIQNTSRNKSMSWIE